jgi:uncharacterized protein
MSVTSAIQSSGLGIEEILKDQRSQILMIAQNHGAYNVRVFGSVARKEATMESDIDFLVDYDLEKITPWFPGGLLLELEALLHRKVDIATVDMLKDRIRDRVLHEAVML